MHVDPELTATAREDPEARLPVVVVLRVAPEALRARLLEASIDVAELEVLGDALIKGTVRAGDLARLAALEAEIEAIEDDRLKTLI